MKLWEKNLHFINTSNSKTNVILSSAVSNSWKTENATHFKVSLVFCFRGHFQLWCQKVKAFGEPKVITKVFLVEQDTIEFSFSIFVFFVYREVMISNISRLEPHPGFYRLHMKGIFDALLMYCDLLTKKNIFLN